MRALLKYAVGCGDNVFAIKVQKSEGKSKRSNKTRKNIVEIV